MTEGKLETQSSIRLAALGEGGEGGRGAGVDRAPQHLRVHRVDDDQDELRRPRAASGGPAGPRACAARAGAARARARPAPPAATSENGRHEQAQQRDDRRGEHDQRRDPGGRLRGDRPRAPSPLRAAVAPGGDVAADQRRQRRAGDRRPVAPARAASSAPFRAAAQPSTPSGAAPTTTPQVGMIGGSTTPTTSPAASARPRPGRWRERSMGGRGGYRPAPARARPLPQHCPRWPSPTKRPRDARERRAGRPAAAARAHDLARPRALRGPVRRGARR